MRAAHNEVCDKHSKHTLYHQSFLLFFLLLFPPTPSPRPSTSPEALMIPNFDYRNNICNNYGILDICTVKSTLE